MCILDSPCSPLHPKTPSANHCTLTHSPTYITHKIPPPATYLMPTIPLCIPKITLIFTPLWLTLHPLSVVLKTPLSAHIFVPLPLLWPWQQTSLLCLFTSPTHLIQVLHPTPFTYAPRPLSVHLCPTTIFPLQLDFAAEREADPLPPFYQLYVVSQLQALASQNPPTTVTAFIH